MMDGDPPARRQPPPCCAMRCCWRLHWDDLAVTVGAAALAFTLLEGTKRFLGVRLWS